VIHLERVSLPRGLSALAHRDPDGNLVIFVSAALDATRQRAAVVEAIRATRRDTWRAGLPLVGLPLVLGIKTAFRRVASALRARPLAWGTVATASVAGVATAGALLLTAPHQQQTPTASGPQPGPSAAVPLPQPSQRPTSRPGHHGRSGHGGNTHLVSSGGSPGASQPSAPGRPAPTSGGGGGGGSAPSPTPNPQPEPSPTPVTTQPAPEPSPTPTGGSGVCVKLLVLKACVPPLTVKVKL
jgi:hypothetical protein